MPFDGTEYDLTTPSLANLAYLLRHREKWPAGFSWDYSSPYGCAIGLAWKKWPDRKGLKLGSSLPDAVVTQVRPPRRWWRLSLPRMSDVQPEHVADAIDRLLV